LRLDTHLAGKAAARTIGEKLDIGWDTPNRNGLITLHFEEDGSRSLHRNAIGTLNINVRKV
jgi:hypothetical protein